MPSNVTERREPRSDTVRALEIARDALRKRGCREFEIFRAFSSALKLEARDEKVDFLAHEVDGGLAIRALADGRVGFSYTTSIAADSIRSAVESALATAELMPRNEGRHLGLFDASAGPSPFPYDEKGLKTEFDRKSEIVCGIERICREEDSRIKRMRRARFVQLDTETGMLSQTDELLSYASTRFSLQLSAVAESDGKSQFGSHFEWARHLSDLDSSRAARRCAGYATRMLGAEKHRIYGDSVVLEGGVTRTLLQLLAPAFYGTLLLNGQSRFHDQIGRKSFGTNIGIVDDATRTNGFATRPFDGEGMRSKRTQVVGAGVFLTPLLDQESARRLALPSTANATRGLMEVPQPGISNFYLEPGETSLAEMLSVADTGVFVTDVMGAAISNFSAGLVSFGASGFLIEKGRLTRPVLGFAISGSLFELFNNVIALGSDIEFDYGIGAPSLLTRSLRVSQ